MANKKPVNPNAPKQVRVAKTAKELFASALALEAKENAKKISGEIAKLNFASLFGEDQTKSHRTIGELIKLIKDNHKVQIKDVLLAFVDNAGLTGLTITGTAKAKIVKKPK